MAETTNKADTTASKPKAGRSVGEAGTDPAPTQTTAAPEGKMESTGPVGDADVIDAQEHVLGDDPRRIQAQVAGGYHDSLTGRSVDEGGTFTDTATKGSEGPIPHHRIVANNWPQEREKLNDPATRVGNEASK